MILWVKVFHLFFIITWFAGLFYLPRLFVYHALATDTIGIERFKIMERKLYFGITTPGALLTILTGAALLSFNFHAYMQSGWMHAKLGLIVLLLIYHGYLGKCYFAFKAGRNTHGHVYYRWLNEVPVLFLLAILVLVMVKPF